MSLGIVIPLKSKKVSENWELTSKLLEETILSIRNQSSDAYKVVVVGHEEPVLSQESKSLIDFISCDFGFRRINHTGEINHYKQIDYILDKNRKLALGLKWLEERSSDYYMVLDADDLIHKDLVSFVVENKHQNGYIINSGYEFFVNRKKLIKRQDMANICGSTTIIHKNLFALPSEISDNTMASIPWCYLSHSHMESYFKEKGFPLRSIPFPALLYKLAHGQNASDEFRGGLKSRLKLKAKLLLKGETLRSEVYYNFGLRPC